MSDTGLGPGRAASQDALRTDRGVQATRGGTEEAKTGGNAPDGSPDNRVTMTLEEAKRVQVVPRAAVDAAKAAARAGFSEANEAEGMRLLRDPMCHAVERHGPQLPDDVRIAQLIWRKDPTGKYTWRPNSDGSVTSTYRVGTVTGGFNSPEALARPLDTLLTVANRRAGSLGRFLDNAAGNDERVGIFVSAKQAGLKPGDASGLQGSGTETYNGSKRWTMAREQGMLLGRVAVDAVPHDPFADGSKPGAAIMFRRVSGIWHLVTLYPVLHSRRPWLELGNL